MNAFETEPVPPQENEKHSEALFTKGDFLVGMLSYLETLWSQHAEAIQSKNTSDRERIRDEIYRAYHSLEECQDDVNDVSVKPETKQAIEFELWMSRNHLRKILH